MPRPWRHPVIADIRPLTDKEVETLWRQAITPGDPIPSPAACRTQTKILNELIWNAADRARAREAARATEAGRLLLKTLSSYLPPFDAVKLEPKAWQSAKMSARPPLLSIEGSSIFSAARLHLVELLSILDRFNFELTPEQASWFGSQAAGRERLVKLQDRITHRPERRPWERTAEIAWLVARDALEAIGRKASMDEASPAMQFTALACRRLGFPDVNARAIAARLIRTMGSNKSARARR